MRLVKNLVWFQRLTKSRHLDGKISVMKYHGKRRKKLIEEINNYDIVITTYNTLAAEHGRAKSGEEKSSLHDIAWYRVVLDEGWFYMHFEAAH